MGVDLFGVRRLFHDGTGCLLPPFLLVAHPPDRIFDGVQFGHADTLVQFPSGMAIQCPLYALWRHSSVQTAAVFLRWTDHRGLSHGR